MNSETVVAALVTLIAGLLIGVLLGRGSRSREARQNAAIEAELNKTREDVEKYRNQVNHHFEKTADLMGELTDSYKEMTRRYKKVYEHLAEGANTLASVDTSRMITSSTIDRLIYEANEDTHVAEKSAAGQSGGNAGEDRPEPADSSAPPAGDEKATKPQPGRMAEGRGDRQERPTATTRANRQGKKPKPPAPDAPASSQKSDRQPIRETQGKKGTGES